MNSTLKWALVLIAGLAIGGTVVFAATSQWGQSIGWTNDSTDFTVYTTQFGTEQANTTITLDNPTDPYQITYWIQNNGTVTLNVTATFTLDSGTVNHSFSPSPSVTVPVGTARVAIILTLSNFSTGTGWATVLFDSEAA